LPPQVKSVVRIVSDMSHDSGMAREPVPGCYSCEHNAQTTLRRHERIYDDGLWRVSHSYNSTWLGWLVLVLGRHARSLSELTPDEADVFGWLVPELSRALEAELNVPKAYVLFLAEQEGFDHLHVHVIARPPEYARGIRVFQLIQQPSEEWVSAADMDELAERIARHLVAR
jgi:diadenosine tetraphosphate (Ap4A) HIT family hydrolase